MKIALINENSQAPKNSLIFDTLMKSAEPYGHTIANYGRYSAEDPHEKTYVQAGLLAAILLNAKAVDFVITGCGTGMGAMLACNSFPGVVCGRVNDPTDAWLFTQVNGGNAISIPYSFQFGWGAEINLKYIFDSLFETTPGQGYPEAWAGAEKRNREILNQVKTVSHTRMIDVLKGLDRKFLYETISEETFPEMFFPACQDEEIAAFLREVLEEGKPNE
ncbi:MAG: RpiB/LacA/LacB family sugar-phosphate isomerase [Lachnospiraceae bacterium]|nr:RpiB/LacA/LacB family sugar-phosphate isomerase [Lachnospiraceae bacterium]